MPLNEDLIQTCKNKIQSILPGTQIGLLCYKLSLSWHSEVMMGVRVPLSELLETNQVQTETEKAEKGWVTVPLTGAGGERGVVNV